MEREQEHSVVYGSIDFGKSVVTCDAYKELLAKTTKSLKIQSHRLKIIILNKFITRYNLYFIEFYKNILKMNVTDISC